MRISEPVRIGVPTSKAELGLVEPELLLNLDADDREDRPDRETDREGDGGHPERTALADRTGP